MNIYENWRRHPGGDGSNQEKPVRTTIEQLQASRDASKNRFSAGAERLKQKLIAVIKVEPADRVETTRALLVEVEKLQSLMEHMQTASLWSHWAYYSEYFFASPRADGTLHEAILPETVGKVSQEWRAAHQLQLQTHSLYDDQSSIREQAFDEEVLKLFLDLQSYQYLQRFILSRQVTETATREFFEHSENPEEFNEVVGPIVPTIKLNEYGTFDTSALNAIYQEHPWFHNLIVRYYFYLQTQLEQYKPDFFLSRDLIAGANGENFDIYLKQLKYDFELSRAPLVSEGEFSGSQEEVQTTTSLQLLIWYFAFQIVTELVMRIDATRKEEAEFERQFEETVFAPLLRSLL